MARDKDKSDGAAAQQEERGRFGNCNRSRAGSARRYATQYAIQKGSPTEQNSRESLNYVRHALGRRSRRRSVHLSTNYFKFHEECL